MRIKSTSKTLFRNIQDGKLVGLFYHKTQVVQLVPNAMADAVQFKTDGWMTMNTAEAMSIGLKELGYSHHVVYLNNKKQQGLFLVNQLGEMKPIKDGDIVSL